MPKKNPTAPSTGAVIHDNSIPIGQKRAAFGMRAITFGDIGNYNWCIKPVIKKETKMALVESEGISVPVTRKRQPCTMFTIVLAREERDGIGQVAPRQHGGLYPLPFYTFDNTFTAAGFEPRDVALAIWQMRQMWGLTIDPELMTDEDVDEYWRTRSSADYIAAREAMVDTGAIRLKMAEAESHQEPLDNRPADWDTSGPDVGQIQNEQAMRQILAAKA